MTAERDIFGEAPRRWEYQAGKRAFAAGIPFDADRPAPWQWGWEDARDATAQPELDL